MTIIKYGLTGGIGCGKSVCSNYLTKSHITIIDADKLTAEAYILANDQLKKAFGNSIFREDHVDRRALAQRVFSNSKELDLLNSIMRPIMAQIAIKKLNTANNIAILDAALLFEAGWDKLVDRVITVVAPLDIRIQRIIQRDNTTKDQALRRINAQISDAERIIKSDYIIYNMGSLEQLHAQCDHIFSHSNPSK